LEPISYLRAPIRRWPVVVSITLVGIIVGLLIPVGSSSKYTTDEYKATAEVGLPPHSKGNGLGAKLGVRQLEFYAEEPAVLATAAKAYGVPVTNALKTDVVVGKTKKKGKKGSSGSSGGGGGAKVGILDVAILQPTKDGAANFTNDFVGALSAYADGQLASQYKTQIATQEAYIANLEKEIAKLTPPKKVKPPAKPTTTTTTHKVVHVHVHHHHHHTKKKKGTRITTQGRGVTHPRAETTSAALASTSSSSPRIQLVADTTSTIANPLTEPTPAGAVPTVATSTTPTTTVPKKTVQDELHVLSGELGGALAGLQKMTAAGATPSGIRIISPASSDTAVKLNPKPPLLSNAFLRALLGLLAGLILGVVATWILDAFDRRLRTSKRAEQVFGLPVIVEIPAVESKAVSAIPVVDVIVDPYSPASEAYRRLHVAILTAPPVTWVRRGYGYQEELEMATLRSPQELVGASARGGGLQAPAGPGGLPNDPTTPSPTAQTLPVPLGSRALATPHRPRFSILVTAPTDEPTRSLVVVNLAAVFAEAGDRVLVATTGGMRTSIDGNGKMPPTWEGPYSDLTASEVVANARPSQIPGVSSLALGQLFPNPSKLALNAPRLVEAARDVVDVLLWEAPLLSTQDGTALMPAADLVVVACEAWHTTVSDGLQSQRLLAQHRPPVLGLVMTNMRADHPSLSAAP
jgi:Mrp family chromosome partitioning ATPase